MSLNHAIDLEALLAPVSETAPQGSDLRADRSPTAVYYRIKDARNAARAAERSALFDDDVDLLDGWRQVTKLAPEILANTSKDLEVTAWYTEALIRVHGLAGLRDGLLLTKRLIEQYWDDLFPLPDEDGLETKVAPLTGLNGDGGDGTLLAPLRNMPITLEDAGGGFSLWQYQQARDADRIVDEDDKSARLEKLGYSLKNITDTIAATALTDAVHIVETLEQCLDLYKSTQALLRSHCDNQAPPSSNIANLLEELLRTARFIYKEKLDAAQAANAAPVVDEDAPAAGDQSDQLQAQVPGLSAGNGAIRDREDALRRIEQIAVYFRRHEPHSPIGPGLERLAQWGRMTVAELMMELLPEASAKGIFSQLTGVKMDGSDTATYVAPPAPATPQKEQTHTAAPAAPAQQETVKMGW